MQDLEILNRKQSCRIKYAPLFVLNNDNIMAIHLCFPQSSTVKEQCPQDDMSMETACIPPDLHGN